MKLAKATKNNEEICGIVQEDFFFPLDQCGKNYTSNLHEIIRKLHEKLITPNEQIYEMVPTFSNIGEPLKSLQLLPPTSKKSKIICVGINYPKLYHGALTSKPNELILFSKYFEAFVGNDQPLRLPRCEGGNSLDYEGEVAIVIGKAAFNINEYDAEKHIFGFTLINDGSVREWQNHSIWAGKNFFQSGSCGPYIVTKDEIKSVSKISFETKLNGKVVQKGKLSQMFFSLNEIIAYVSNIIPLEPGDIIATGSPEGTGASRIPNRFLCNGDIIEICSDTLGSLKNSILKS